MDTWLLVAYVIYDSLKKQSVQKPPNPKIQTLQETIAVRFAEYFEMTKGFALRQNESEVIS